MSDERDDMREQIAALKAENERLRDAVVLLRGALSDVQEHRVALRAALQALVDVTIMPWPPGKSLTWVDEVHAARKAALRVLRQAPQETP